ncbi:uncharacterized protein DNG_08063 [Cephalotrichum gorgonifer]|uniref:NmrA-like domain-containing protein n=1 Tax=Cephalotrichum gorgonifer TaxID=2041049 RepID=A0AAE8N2S3_9PEZI|nr:uncharacterized protein DNG_08063 [Cephalotrichum gorgonifer]
MSPPLTVFVCGATGTQGGATARHLLSHGATVHALARDPSSPKAVAIASAGVKLWPGDFDGEAALRAAIAGTEAVYLNFMPDFTEFGANLRQAKLILRVAKEAGVRQIVYTSYFSLDQVDELLSWGANNPLAAFFASKRDIESEVRTAGFQYWTILRPATFMSNYLNPSASYYDGLVGSGRWNSALREDSVLPIVDTETIGVFSSTALLGPVRFHARVIAYADEVISVGQILQKLSRATGRDLQIVPLSEEDVLAQRGVNPFVGGQVIMRTMADEVNIDEVRSWGLPLSSFDKFLEREKTAVEETYLKSA